MAGQLELTPAQRFRVRCALAPDGMTLISLTRTDALQLARSWEAAERSWAAEAAYQTLQQELQSNHAKIVEGSEELLAASQRLRRRFWGVLIACSFLCFEAGFIFATLRGLSNG